MKKIPIKIKSSIRWVVERTIIRFEAKGRKTIVVFENKKRIISSETLQHYEEMLHGKTFYRINHKDMVNKEHVDLFCYKTRTVTLSCRTKLLASFRKRRRFYDFMHK
ncbi:MAG: LytTR family transcriptional regulator DNA-binding domain-containing protein [Bacteroidetes bacterium]|nr:LytTR family transcriptional regulator DNA-binding domain-containing protein [Bacteroidota bacterium]